MIASGASRDSTVSIRFLACLAASLFIVFPGPLLAQDQESVLEIQRIQAALAVINAEIRANLDEISSLQQALQANAQAQPAQGQLFDDVAAAQQRAYDNAAAFNARIQEILARNAELGAQKQPLLERLQELLRQ
jgi:hypothetical protein